MALKGGGRGDTETFNKVTYFSDIPANIVKYFSVSHSKIPSFSVNEFSPVALSIMFLWRF